MAKRGPKDKKISLSCDACGKIIKKPPCLIRSKNYCNGKCRAAGAVKKETVVCDSCGEKISRVPSLINQKNYCSQKCKGESMKGHNVSRVSVVCQNCGIIFDVVPSRADAKFCSSDCFGESIKGNSRKETWPRTEYLMKIKARGIKDNIFVCKNCGKAFIRWRRNGDEGKEYCSRECYYDKIVADKLPPACRRRSLVYFNKCDVCGTMFTGKSKLKYCSQECQRSVHYKTIREKYRKTQAVKKNRKPCEQCGKPFWGWPKNRFCSRGCRRSYNNYMREPRHRARALGVYYEPVNPLKVFIRDGWRCQQCNKKLNPKNKGKMIDNAPQLDHILPWAQGGEHSYKNTQLLCRKCNLEKSSQPIGQMLMFGELEIRRESVGQRA